MNKNYFLIISTVLLFSCNIINKKPENKTNSDDEKSVEFYKQFDSTITKSQLDSFKTKIDSLHRWNDSKIKRRGF